MTSAQHSELNRWMILLADGDRSVFQSVFELAWPLVRGYAFRLLSGSADAEDVAQQAMVNVFSRAHEFRSSEPALPWILGIVTYECKSHLKRVSRRREDFGQERALEKFEDRQAGPEQVTITKSAIDAVMTTLEQLSPLEREAVLSAILEINRPEVQPAAFRKRLQRGMEKFRMLWRAEHDWE